MVESFQVELSLSFLILRCQKLEQVKCFNFAGIFVRIFDKVFHIFFMMDQVFLMRVGFSKDGRIDSEIQKLLYFY